MIKLLGSLCILSGGALIWRTQMTERRRRMEILTDLLYVLRRMTEEIRMARTPLPTLWKKLSEDCGSDVRCFFEKTAESVEQGNELSEVWRAKVGELPIAPEVRKCVANLGSELHGDEESICKALSLVTYELSKYSAKSQDERRMEEQRTTALCFSGAALLIILLI